MEDLKRKLASLEKQNESLKQANDGLIQEVKSLKQSSVTTQQTHSQSFWYDIHDKMKTDLNGIKSLIKNKIITVTDADSFGETLLIYATNLGNYEIAQLCVNLGADIRHINGKGKDAIFKARKRGYHHVEQLLLLSEMKANVGQRIKNISTSIKKQNGIIENILNELNQYDKTTRAFFKNTIVDLMIKIMDKKLIFSDDILNLCWKIEEINGDPLKSKLWQTINKTSEQIIRSNNNRDWYWFKTVLNASNIWFTRNANGKYLYYHLLQMVEEESKNQLNKLEKNIQKEASNDQESWNKLIKMNIHADELVEVVSNSYVNQSLNPRQDNIPNGLTPTYSKQQLHESATTAAFDGALFYDHHQYLSQLTLLAQTVDAEFQQSVQTMFNINHQTHIGKLKRNKNELEQETKYDDDILIEYSQGPVKLLERARNKAANDYYNEAFPTSACVLDLNRCSLVFNDIKSLLFGVDLFIKKVTHYQSGSIIGVTRMKNKFTEYSENGPGYADIKLNVLIKGKTNNIIGEVQFLLKTFRDFKKIAHNLYGISREEEFISESVTKILPSLIDIDEQIKICASLGDIKAIHGIMVNCNKTIKDIAIVNKDTNDSILNPICQSRKVKAFKFIKSLMPESVFVEHLLWTKGKSEKTPIEEAIRKWDEKMIKAIFNTKGIREIYEKEKKWQFRAIYQAFVYCIIPEIIDILLNELGLNDKQLVLLFNYEYDDKQSIYYKKTLVAHMVQTNNVNILRKIISKMDDNQRVKHIFMANQLNRNALEYAIERKKLDIIKYLFEFDEVKQEVMNQKELLWRVVFWLNRYQGAQSVEKKIIKYTVSTLNITEKSLNELISYKVSKPADMTPFDENTCFDYWNQEIPKEVIKQLMN